MKVNFFIYIAIVLSVFILIGSLVSIQVNSLRSVSSSDKLIHGVAYAILNFSWLLAFRKIAKIRNNLVIISILVLFYGIIIEVLQHILTNYREADFYDIVANFIGISLSVIVFSLFFKKKL